MSAFSFASARADAAEAPVGVSSPTDAAANLPAAAAFGQRARAVLTRFRICLSALARRFFAAVTPRRFVPCAAVWIDGCGVVSAWTTLLLAGAWIALRLFA
jgi:hypothetical protein